MSYLKNGFLGFCEAIDGVRTPVLFCERFDEKSNIWNFSQHKHEFIELIYFLQGNARVITMDSTVRASFYDIVIYPRGMYHTECLQPGQHQEIICLWVDIPGLELPDIIRIQDRDTNLKWLLESLHAEYKSKTPCKELIEHYVKTAAMLIARLCFDHENRDDVVGRVVGYMHDHLSERITVQQLADLVYVSKSYLSRIFRRETGVSLMHYLNLLRMEAAKSMLALSSMNTAEIAQRTGYQSTKFFYRAFRDYTGITTREYRMQRSDRRAAGSQ